MARKSSFDEASAGFRSHLPDLSSPRFTTAAKQNIYEYVQSMQENRAPPWLYDLTKVWEKLLEEPYKGITNDGSVREGLFNARDEGADVGSAVKAAEELMSGLDVEQKRKISYPIHAREWRAWSNPEFLLRPFGLRLEEGEVNNLTSKNDVLIATVPEQTAQSILRVVEASLSPEGYNKALAAMRVNHFLGEVVKLPNILNKYSYNFLLFGTPSTSASSPWGWLLYGHHLDIACFFKGSQVILSPSFTGAEPNIIDAGEWKGTEILHKEGTLGLKLMQSFGAEQQQKAQIFKNMRDEGMKQVYGNSNNDETKRDELITDTWGPDDQRHRCGAFRDNRIVPYEGVLVSTMEPFQQELILSICHEFLLYHPTKARQLKLDQIKQHFGETYFCWIGGFGNDDAFYFRIQSPVILVEFDHHSGVFLTNKEPAKYHTHTIVRTPNAGDYGQAIRQGDEKLQ
ncbi:hypothetical protein CFE70_006852 [Pyrenophora teres f. teres 0-1]|uniref:DUF3500 domain containing protein n=1 Tax=Pyrenophora teres f. teres TaxID=97479 RepID=A0A6S6WAP3_9PLEO|nr:hypothetical protein HRS9122_10016 [Pyrenophora teres f. teres]KAE8831068.1 hypothetical protein PTNB85_07655 [Pyrenophora teres f. teres]KAE8856932.1 hypothetical protein PTNB29_07999 [Pyrenophora teres f. teres]KAE8863715.1 hypothetical protein PTNB73_06922 [Pyrenophora teres f. teres]CAE7188805.1 DUF3500 domain containing protein [Pyrenophora teres f. teres]